MARSAPERAVAAGLGVSLGFVVDESEPAHALALCEAVMAAAPSGVRVEFLLLDDHTNPLRRELVNEVDLHGDAVRLVPRPGQQGCARLDAVSHSSGSEFVVVPFGQDVPWEALTTALGELFADGADVVAVGATDPIAGDVGDIHSRLAGLLGLAGASAQERRGSCGRFVVVRRWVARWLFSDVSRGVDVGEEMADRARLLGLRMIVLDDRGTPVEHA